MSKHFFDTVRPLFGKLKADQVTAMELMISYGKDRDVSRLHLAYILATVFHETAKWMIPIREGARRYGVQYTDAQSRRAVASIFAKGIIRYDYALPGSYGNSFYGRGLVQTTHEENYRKVGELIGADLVRHPDKLLEWQYSLPATFEAMANGLYTGKGLDMIESQSDYREARAIVNGDVRKNGQRVADAAMVFYEALAEYDKPRLRSGPRKQPKEDKPNGNIPRGATPIVGIVMLVVSVIAVFWEKFNALL